MVTESDHSTVKILIDKVYNQYNRTPITSIRNNSLDKILHFIFESKFTKNLNCRTYDYINYG